MSEKKPQDEIKLKPALIFKMPKEIGANRCFDLNARPVCSLGHLYDQFNTLHPLALANAMEVHLANFTKESIWELTSLNDRARPEQRPAVLRGWLAKHAPHVLVIDE